MVAAAGFCDLALFLSCKETHKRLAENPLYNMPDSDKEAQIKSKRSQLKARGMKLSALIDLPRPNKGREFASKICYHFLKSLRTAATTMQQFAP